MCRPVISGVLQGLELGLALFDSFVGDLNSGTECSLTKFTDNTNLCGVINTLPLQKHLGRLERWGHLNLMKSNNPKHKVLHLGEGNPKHQYRLDREWIESSPEKKDLGVLVEEKLNMTRQCALGSAENQLYCKVASEAARAAGQGRGFCRIVDLLEQGQRRPRKMFRGLKHLSYQGRLREPRLFSLEKGGL